MEKLPSAWQEKFRCQVYYYIFLIICELCGFQLGALHTSNEGH